MNESKKAIKRIGNFNIRWEFKIQTKMPIRMNNETNQSIRLIKGINKGHLNCNHEPLEVF